MTEVRRKENPDGKTVIYVLKCTKYKKYISFKEPIYKDINSKYFIY